MDVKVVSSFSFHFDHFFHFFDFDLFETFLKLQSIHWQELKRFVNDRIMLWCTLKYFTEDFFNFHTDEVTYNPSKVHWSISHLEVNDV